MVRSNIAGNRFCHGPFECYFHLKHFGSISVYMYHQHFRIKSYDIQMGKNKMYQKLYAAVQKAYIPTRIELDRSVLH